MSAAQIAVYTLGDLVSASDDRAVFRIAAPQEDADAGSCLLLRETVDEVTAEDQKNRFLEAMFLRGPNIVRVLDAGALEHSGQWFTFAVTEKLDQPLRDAPRESLPGIALAISAGLEFLHEQDLVYCALSSNTVWCADGEWKLADFGELRVSGNYNPQETRRLMIRRDLSVPPEAWEGVISAKWDAWSLGNLLHVVGSPAPQATSFNDAVAGLLEPDPSQRTGVAEFRNRVTATTSPAARPAAQPAPDHVIRTAPEELVYATPQRVVQPLAPLPPELEDTRRSGRVHASAARFMRTSGRILVWASVAFGFAVLLLLAMTVWGQHAAQPSRGAAVTPAAGSPAPTESQATASPPASTPPGMTQRQADNRQIEQLLSKWVESTRTRNVDEQVSCYAPVVERFFGRSNLTSDQLRRAKLDAFATIGEVRTFTISDPVVRHLGPDFAVLVFDKRWDFPERRFSGTERDQMQVRRIAGEWKIVSERNIGERRTRVDAE